MTAPATNTADQQSSTPKPSARSAVHLSPQQYAKLTEELHPGRIGTDGKGFSHVEAWDVEASLTRIFGFGMWAREIVAEECISAERTDSKWWVSWRVRVRLTAYDPQGNMLGPFEDGTIETGCQPKLGEAHELAYKAAISGAMKRCAKALGNQFGLSLYAKSKNRQPVLSVVSTTLNPPTPPSSSSAGPTQPDGQTSHGDQDHTAPVHERERYAA
ncbi:Rad52/Rad22 family DNA repair protein [Streptomyces sp. N35]|uniref:Rad52/Rad22 family DNA repair protein n=1 Tax=Streptomyces sp. N35 TaxID=2795730 RepID=UPI0018F36FDB|nr:Rad52/Rad22 family DNA repair protein [Streptomyces sp. N35]